MKIEQKLRKWYRNSYPGNTWEEHFDAMKKLGDNYFIFYVKNQDGEVIASRNLSLNVTIPKLQDLEGSLKSNKVAQSDALYVDEGYRTNGIGAALVQEMNRYALQFFDLDYVVSVSRHVNALRMYKTCGAQFVQKDIEAINCFCGEEQNQSFFEAFLRHKEFSQWKLNSGIRYHYGRDIL